MCTCISRLPPGSTHLSHNSSSTPQHVGLSTHLKHFTAYALMLLGLFLLNMLFFFPRLRSRTSGFGEEFRVQVVGATSSSQRYYGMHIPAFGCAVRDDFGCACRGRSGGCLAILKGCAHSRPFKSPTVCGHMIMQGVLNIFLVIWSCSRGCIWFKAFIGHAYVHSRFHAMRFHAACTNTRKD
jgi:hypothetical protein